MCRVCISIEEDLSLGGDTTVFAWQHEVTVLVARVILGAESLP